MRASVLRSTRLISAVKTPGASRLFVVGVDVSMGRKRSFGNGRIADTHSRYRWLRGWRYRPTPRLSLCACVRDRGNDHPYAYDDHHERHHPDADDNRVYRHYYDHIDARALA